MDRELKVGQEIYNIKNLEIFFSRGYKNRSAKEVFSWITDTVKKVHKTHFFTTENQLPNSKYSNEGQRLDAVNTEYCAFEKQKVVDLLEEQKKESFNNLVKLDNDEIKRLQNKIKLLEKREHLVWEHYNEKCKTLEDIKIFIKEL